MVQRRGAILTLFLATTSVCLPATHARKTAPAKPPRPVVTRLVRLDTRAHKPMPPIAITLVPGEMVGVGQQRARIWVKPLVDAERVEIKVETRDGLALARGRDAVRQKAPGDPAAARTLNPSA